MAQQHREPLLTVADASAGEALARYLHQQATEFLRGLRLHADGGEAAGAAGLLRSAARRIAGALEVYRPLTDTGWADALRDELAWAAEALGREYVCEARLARLRGALHRLFGAPAAGVPGTPGVGAARAGALLERQLTLARNRAHSTALQALGSARFHALADAVALLSADPPLAPSTRPDDLTALAARTHRLLLDAVGALPLSVAGLPYNAEALAHGPDADGRQDVPWHRVRSLLRLRRYAQEVLDEQHRAEVEPALSVRLLTAGQALDRHRDAAGAAAAAAAAARTPRIAPATAYALGVLHADQRHEVEAARFAFGRIWQRAS
ncbi:CHAD domain-containing protein [Streptomyces caatingaensis]|uniref:Metal-binding protein n=1 Tax=Streptomyces caatingaensis TaxID=1678637 RepID=A0A0K9XDW4_9ACTN|nr:CHAD domain-containing protein [Streptomyces caatingaensis]KNB51433.1 metal-binding protein [Streptomyces caatingaensis]